MGLVKRIEEIKEIDNEIFTKPGHLKCKPIKIVLKDDAKP